MEYRLRNDGVVILDDYGEHALPAVWTGPDGLVVWNMIPALSAPPWMNLKSGRTGVMVVSSQPQSTTSPVIRPQEANARTLDDVNAIEGTFIISLGTVRPVVCDLLLDC